ncbi:MAG: PrsW family intramembrane metalloprotease [Candidatus Dormibacteraeota bacterium]|nr:PrsW family intramembrane metalloprotease [Candidatus Dormibacteraeota bacterium]
MTTAAYPHPHRPPRYRVAAVLGGGVVAAVLLGALFDLAALRSPIALLDLAAILLVGLFGLGTWLLIRALERDPGRRRRNLIRAAVVLGVALGMFFFAVNLLNARLNLLGVFLCLPNTTVALYLIRRVDHNEREPWRVVLVAAGWGAVVATTVALIFESIWGFTIDRGLIPGPGQQVATAFNAALFEEVPKGLVIAFLFLLMRDEFDNVVDGIVYGAAVGLGFNYMETIVYMSVGGLPQYFLRQWIGLFVGHATYTALIGAGFGIARQMRGRIPKALAILSGFVVAIAAHFSWDAWLWYFPHPSDANLMVFVIPLQYLAITGPFTLVLGVLIVLGLRTEGRALARQFEAEAAVAGGAVTPAEVAILASPGRRTEARFRALRAGGPRAYLRLRRLQRAQIDLGMERWHRERREIDSPLEAELRLRDRVLAIRSARR